MYYDPYTGVQIRFLRQMQNAEPFELPEKPLISTRMLVLIFFSMSLVCVVKVMI